MKKPDPAKINSDKATTIVGTKCDDMAGMADTKGNMYLLKNGQCVQSFSSGELDAVIEDTEEGQT